MQSFFVGPENDIVRFFSIQCYVICMSQSYLSYVFDSVKDIKMESTMKLSYLNFQWTKILYQNNLKHIAFFFTFFKT